jgi:hypothetical protein
MAVAITTVAQRTLIPASTMPGRMRGVVGGGTSGISIFLDLKKYLIAKCVQHLLCHDETAVTLGKNGRLRQFLTLGGLN